ncbi:PepSY domain-containing protein [Acuticoccus kandeliae]|uniref:PepSY domain-containing protein n=1 Tax=Acuticoccus kandeliae TaxID=2073160 RepID=UPI000D3EB47E|nr:PepSY domain-containing protein [Acuticoccus kandeliae]
MIRTLILSSVALAAFGAGSAFAEDARCNVPVADWQPREVLQAKLEGEGWKIRNIKTDEGCYEVYGFDKDGKRKEVYFDPKTFEAVGEDD